MARYVHLRLRRPEFAHRRSEEVEKDILTCNAKMEEHEQLLRSTLEFAEGVREKAQSEIRQQRKRKQRLLVEQRRLSRIALSNQPTPRELRAEFSAIRSIPSVYTTRVYGAVLYVELAARLTANGHRYHLGNWKISVDLRDDLISTKELQSGLTQSAMLNPEYRSGQYSWSGFCFGSNAKFVERLVERGDYVTAIQAAATYMNDVNSEHRELVDIYYRKVA